MAKNIFQQFKYSIPDSSRDYVLSHMLLDSINDTTIIYRLLEVLVAFDIASGQYKASRPIFAGLNNASY